MSSNEGSLCRICAFGHIVIQNWFHPLPRVTSDCKPFPSGGDLGFCDKCYAIQKIPNSRFLTEIDSIYKNYQAYEIACGEEQLVLDLATNSLCRRSDLIVRELKNVAILPNVGKILDIGCGHGVTLKAFSNQFVNWDLYGYEQTSNDLVNLKNLPKFRSLFIGDLGKIVEKFHLITLIHTLEHLLNPFEFLRDVSNLLENEGGLFIEVCNIRENPFDILVADHLFHFSPEVLRLLLNRAGFKVHWMKTDLVKKELSVFAIKDINHKNNFEFHAYESDHFELLLRYKNIIFDILSRSKHALQNSEPIGIFGTSIAGSWLGGVLGDSVDFFIDEDLGRIGKKYMNKLVISPAEIPLNSSVILALAPAVADIVEAKISRADITLIKPLSTEQLSL